MKRPSPHPIGAAGSLALAFDLSGPVAGVGLAVAGRVVADRDLGARRGHAARLLPALAEMLSEVRRGKREITDIVVGEGPGSFTGLRVAAATAKGLCRSLGARLWPVPSLAAAALSEPAAGRSARYVLFDARADRVFGACYAVASSSFEELVAPHAGTLGALVRAGPPLASVFSGDGSRRHAQRLSRAGYVVTDRGGVASPAGMLRYLSMGPRTLPEPNPGTWEPRYVRPWRPGRPSSRKLAGGR